MHGPKWPFLFILNCIWTRCGLCENLGYVVPWVELPVQKKLCPIFREWCRVTRHPRVFLGLTGCQRTPGNWASHKLLFKDNYFFIICFSHICVLIL